MKVFIDPPNSLVLYDLVERFGHQPLSAMAAIQERVDNLEVDMPPMNVSDRVALAKRHLAKSLELKGEKAGILEMRRHLSCYFKGLPDFKETRLKLVTLTDPDELYETLDYVAGRWGDAAPAAGNVYDIPSA